MKVKCYVQDTVSPARAQTQTAISGGKCTNHEATVLSQEGDVSVYWREVRTGWVVNKDNSCQGRFD